MFVASHFPSSSAIRHLLDDVPQEINDPFYNEDRVLPDFSERTKWMGDIEDGALLSELSIPGTHDSGAWEDITETSVSLLSGSDRAGNNIARITGGGLGAVIGAVVTKTLWGAVIASLVGGEITESIFVDYTATQTWTIEQQLDAGIRFLDIRCRHLDGECLVVHNAIDLQQTLDDVLTTVRAFLAANPTEAVLIKIKGREENFLGEAERGDPNFNSTYVSKYLPAYNDILWPSTTSCNGGVNTNPRLRDIRGKAVVIQEFSDLASGDCHGIPYASTFRKFSSFQATPEDLWTVVQNGLGNATTGSSGTHYFIGLNGNRLNDAAEGPSGFAKILNPRTHDWLDSYKGRVGIVAMDYPGPSLIFRVIMQNRGVAKQPCSNNKVVCAELSDLVVHVKTQDIADAGTDADIFLQLSADGGQAYTSKHLLDTAGHDDLERGSLDTYTLRDWDLAGRSDVQVVLTRPGSSVTGSGWAAEWVQVNSRATNLTTRFDVDAWLEASSDDEQDLAFPATEVAFAVTNYTLVVKTADERLAGTDGDVFVTLHGATTTASSRRLRLDDGSDNFEAGDTDTFMLEFVRDVGDIGSVTVEQEGGGGWKLASLELTPAGAGAATQVLAFNGWVEGDGSVEVLSAAQSATYTVVVDTADVHLAGTDGDVYVQLIGELGMTARHNLDNDGNDFERGNSDSYTFSDLDIGVGSPWKLVVGQSGGGGWLLASVTVESDKHKDMAAFFVADQWIDGDGQLQLTASDPGSSQQARYSLVVRTADKSGAGTDGDVWITLYGTRGATGPHFLDKAGRDDFERANSDDFFFVAGNVGTLTGMVVGQSGGGGWDLADVTVAVAGASGARQTKTFSINREVGRNGCFRTGTAAPGSSSSLFWSSCPKL